MSCWRNIASLPSLISTGDFAASFAAHSSTAASNSSAGDDLVDDPEPLGLRGVIRSPSSSSSVVFLRGDVAVDQRHDHEREDADVDLGRPELGAVLRDDQVAGERDARARPRARGRWRRRSSACRARRSAGTARGKRSVPKCLWTSGTSAANPPRLPPDEKIFSCEEVSTTQRTASSSRALEGAISPSSSSSDSALRVSGWSSVIVATPRRRPRSARSRATRPSWPRFGGVRKVGSPTIHFLAATRYGPRYRSTRMELRRRSPPRPPPATVRHRPEARLRHATRALHLHRRARAAPRVDPQLRRARSSRRTPRSGRRRRSTNWVFPRMGELGFLGLDKPEEYGGQGGDYYSPLVLAEEMTTSTPAAWRWASRSTPTWRCRRSSRSAPRSRSRSGSVPAIKGEKILVPRHHRAGRGLRRRGHQDPRGPRRRRVRHQRLQDVHHQRPPRRRDRPRHEDRPGRRLRRLHAVPRADGRAGRHPREEAREARHARIRHRAARLPGRSRARRPPCSAGRQGLFPHHVGAPGRAHDRRGRARRRRRAALQRTLQYALERTAFGRPIGSSR